MTRSVMTIENRPMQISIDLPDANIQGLRNTSDLEDLLYNLNLMHPYWIYRGLKNSQYELMTSFERKVQDRSLRASLYDELKERFLSTVHHFKDLEYIPADEESLELQSLMQQYGCPTTLMDWTFSPYVGLYFATEDATENSQVDGAIYALNALMLWRILPSYFEKIGVHFEQETIFSQYGHPSIYRKIQERQCRHNEGYIMPVEPYRRNRRLFIQQGIYTTNGNLFYSFSENLALLLQHAAEIDLPEVDFNHLLIKVSISPPLKREIQKRLLLMNITSNSLFPGLDGFARYWNQYLLERQLRFEKYILRKVQPTLNSENQI